MTFKDIKNKALAGYNEKVRDIKKMALTGLAGLVVGAGGAGGAFIADHWAIYDEATPRDTSLVFFLKNEDNSPLIDSLYSYKVELWKNEGGQKGEPLGTNTRLQSRLGGSTLPYFWGGISLLPILEKVDWNHSEGLYFELSPIKSPLRGTITPFDTYSGTINYGTSEESSAMSTRSIPEPHSLGLLALGAAALKKSRKDKKRN